MTVFVLTAIAWSVGFLALLCLGDPKRRRTAEGGRGRGHDGASDGAYRGIGRQALCAAACAPGVLLAFSGDAAGFLLWLAACAVAGWIVAMAWSRAACARQGPPRSP